ncbi:putative transcription factor [Forsythia ovata]|uniref:Transcription factor n=1 Tax=Forsythia ovata TaxID=205694 RepID=A0ABD1VFS7_9LAMI
MTPSTSKTKRKSSTAVKHRNSPKSLPPQPPSFTSQKSNRLFTQEDEINLLKSLLNPTTNPFPNSHFSEAQITDKLRRLKQKYHKLAKTKSSIKTPHDRKIYEIARQIWGKKILSSSTPMGDDRKRKGSEGDESINWSDFPVLMKHVSRAFPGNVEVYKEGLKGLGADILKGLNEKWMMLEMEEAEIIARRAQLCYHQMKLNCGGF